MSYYSQSNNDYSNLRLKSGYENRPLWVCGDGHVFLETFSPVFKQAYDFCIAIAEPISRPEFIHEYQITSYSLYAAISVGLSSQEIVSTLGRLSKNEMSPELIEMIYKETEKCGKVKLVLKNGRYFIESEFEQCLKILLEYEEIDRALVDINETLRSIPNFEKHESNILAYETTVIISDPLLEDTEKTKIKKKLYVCEVKPEFSEQVKKSCRDIGYPSLEEYDFRLDKTSKTQDMKLKIDTDVRPYQKKSLSRMFGNGRARSGIIVLPCGAGKTLVGISAATTINRSTIVFATTGVSCQQWKSQFLKWTNLDNPGKETDIRMFIASTKDPLPNDRPCIVITTYSMIAFSRKRSREAEIMMDGIRNREWGLVILDEVHVAPADMFRKCLSITKSKCKLGLTATLVREDEKIDDLFFLIGPKLYEADWLNLQKDRYLATVQCIEVWCPMAPAFCKKYLEQNSVNRKTLLQTMNPVKFRNCEYLIKYHEEQGDKIMVFSDNIFSLKKYAVLMGKPFIYGKTSETERMLTLDALQNSRDMNTIFISKIGDCSIDLPDVNVIIEISSHFSSRRQEAQRLGRILRPKAKSDSSAFFYALVSQDTDECFYASKRQRFLVDQGFSFHVRKSMVGESDKSFMYFDSNDQEKLLEEVMKTEESLGVIESDMEDLDGDKTPNETSKKQKRNVKGDKATPKKLKSNKMKNIKANLERIRMRKQELKSEQVD